MPISEIVKVVMLVNSTRQISLQKAAILRLVMHDHITLQKTLRLFNSTFGIFVTFSIGLVFFLCLVGFYATFKLQKTDDLSSYVGYLSNGIQMLIR
jgi:hypothetical protein